MVPTPWPALPTHSVHPLFAALLFPWRFRLSCNSAIQWLPGSSSDVSRQPREQGLLRRWILDWSSAGGRQLTQVKCEFSFYSKCSEHQGAQTKANTPLGRAELESCGYPITAQDRTLWECHCMGGNIFLEHVQWKPPGLFHGMLPKLTENLRSKRSRESQSC